MRLAPLAAAALAALLLAPSGGAASELPPECRRFETATAKPNDFGPRLARLCVRLIDAHDSNDGLSQEEREAATRLGHYLAVVGELDLRKGAVGVNGVVRHAQAATTETARYLIARRIGLLQVADRLAPHPRAAALN